MPPTSAAAEPAPNRHGRLNGGQSIPGRNGSKALRNPAKSILGAEAPATLRDQLSSDYDAQSAVEREPVLRLASLLWRLCRAITMETGLFEIQADHLNGFRQARQVQQPLERLVYALFGRAESASFDRDAAPANITNGKESIAGSAPKSVELAADPAAKLARCFLRLANLPTYALDRLSRYEATLWRQVRQILFALDALDRRKLTRQRAPFPCRQLAMRAGL
jgi:hypothetical protein